MIFGELRNLLEKRKYRGYSLFYSLKSMLFIFLYDCVRFIPTPFGELARYLVLKMFCKKIQSLWIRGGTAFFFPENVSIGKRVSINDNVFINAYGGVEIADNSGVAYGSALISEDHDIDDPDIPMREQGKTGGKITLETNVWVASNCVILKNVTIGEGSVIAAGSVVTRSVPPYSIVGGNPARVIRRRKRPQEEETPQDTTS
jgi:acetyltransferase-like isoleucine patch superfamily enzyme